MKITGTRTEVSEVEIKVDVQDVWEEISKKILKANGFPSNCYIKEGKIISDCESYTMVVDPTPNSSQKELIEALNLVEREVMCLPRDK
jgi:hypothetical protein